MSRIEITVTGAPDHALLTLDELCRLAAVSPQWVQLHLEEGLIEVAASKPKAACFDAVALARVRRLVLVERGFDAAPELAALVADLEDEIARLRSRLR